MAEAPTPDDEVQRIEALHRCCVLDTEPEQRFDDLTLLASRLMDTPMALVSLVDEQRQWFKARTGLSLTETPRGQAFCAHAILKPQQALVVPDASADARFADNPLVTGPPGIRAYAGVPLIDHTSGQPLGTLCVLDNKPRRFGSEQLESLAALARQAAAQLHLSHLNARLQAQNEAQQRAHRQMLEYKEQLEQSVAELKRLSSIDTLTGLANRRTFNERLQAEFERSARYGTDLALVMIDLDHFKHVNDRHGHQVGDQVLSVFGALLNKSRRHSDTLARYGGEEFALILPNTSIECACRQGERLREQIRQHDWPCGELTVSIGVAGRLYEDSTMALLQRADRALYAAKKAGRDRVIRD